MATKVNQSEDIPPSLQTYVFEVTMSLSSYVSRDADGSTSVGYTAAKLANVTSLVLSSQSQFVVTTIDGNVLGMSLAKLFNGSFNVLHTSWLAHLFGREVGVATSSVPVTGDSLGVNADLDTPIFGHSSEQEAGHCHVVAHLDSFDGSDLKLPLRR